MDKGEKSIGRSRPKERRNERTYEKSERDDLIIGQACTLTYFRESVVKGAVKPESRQQGRKGGRDMGRGRGCERGGGPRVNLDGRLLVAAAVETRR